MPAPAMNFLQSAGDMRSMFMVRFSSKRCFLPEGNENAAAASRDDRMTSGRLAGWSIGGQSLECGLVADHQGRAGHGDEGAAAKIRKSARHRFAGDANQLGDLFVRKGYVDADSLLSLLAPRGP